MGAVLVKNINSNQGCQMKKTSTLLKNKIAERFLVYLECGLDNVWRFVLMAPPRYYFTQLHCKVIGCLTKLQYMNFMYMYTCLLCIHESVGMNIVREKQ
jgi:hypothetical protein